MISSKTRSRNRFLGLLALVGACLPCFADKFKSEVYPVLENYCIDCHDGSDGRPKGDFDLAPFVDSPSALANPEAMKRIRDVLHFREMPPENKKRQPGASERKRVGDWIEGVVFTGTERDPGAPVLRRLTRLEYNNTVRDLLGLETDLFSFSERLMAKRDYFRPETGSMGDKLDIFIPEYGSKQPVLLRRESLPGDNRAAHGFFNQGDRLNVSPLLMERYLALATSIVNHEEFPEAARKTAALFGREAVPPRPVTSRNQNPPGRALTVEAVREFAPLDNVNANAPDSSDQAWLFRDHVASAHAAGVGGVFQGARGNLDAGETIKVVYGTRRERALKIRVNADLWFVDFNTAHETSQPVNIANRRKGEKTLHFEFELAGARSDEGIVNLGLVVLSRAKNSRGTVTLTAHFAGGATSVLRDEIATGAGADNTFFAWSAPPGDAIVGLTFDGSGFSGDYALLDDIAFITGRSSVLAAKAEAHPERTAPPPAAKPPPRATASLPDVDPLAALTPFLTQAFRGEVSEAEVSVFRSLYETEIRNGGTTADAMKEVVRAVLSSPRFLFLVEDAPGQGPTRRLSGPEIANRLSYFLWSTMPDAELFAAARSGELDAEDGIARQVARMLRDPKVKELSDSFAYQWLQLNKLIGAQPDPRRYAKFYAGPKGKETMAAPLLQEALLLFETTLIENRPIMDLVDPDYTWMNHRVMEFYGLEGRYPEQLASAQSVDKKGTRRIDDGRWFRCKLPDRKRGGVLSMGSVLTLTSLPLRTSPVYRGSWVAEVVFNRPPPPPPAMVDELGADDRAMQEAGLTLRGKLEAHRGNSACSGCHSRIDPLGFALENYDGIGRWRDSYGQFPVDAAGTLRREHAYDDIIGFKNALRKLEPDFTHGFTRHLLTYALGRPLQAYDEPSIGEIVAQTTGGKHRLQDLILAIATSHPFTHTRNEGSREAREASVRMDLPGTVDTPPPGAQQAMAGKMGAKAQQFEMWKDKEGNVTGLIFINHQALNQSAGMKPGIDDDDLATLGRFPKLTALNIEAQAVGDAGIAELKRFPGLKQVGFHYMAKNPGASASPDFITAIDGMRDLEILEIKHNFRMPAINVDQLKGPFPKVWRLVLDTPLTAEQTLHLLSLCPNVTDLQLHRTRLTGAQLEQAATTCPKVEVLWWKPRDGLKGEHLAALKHFKRLRIYSPQQFRNEPPFEGGWSHLRNVPTLQRLEVEPGRLGRFLDPLKQAMPGLTIDGTLTRSRNYDGL